MNKTICIHQPDFLPYLGFFDRLLKSDLFVVLDNVQFLRRGWHHRDKIKTLQGVQWLTVPIQKKNRYSQLIKDTKIENGTHWKRKHLSTIEQNYSKAPYFRQYIGGLQRIYEKSFDYLLDLNMELLQWSMGILGCSIKTVFASSLPVTSTGSLRLVEIVEFLGGTTYLSGTGAKAYLEEELFTARNLAVKWQNFIHPIYPQLFGNFVPNLSVLDCVLNCGDESGELFIDT